MSYIGIYDSHCHLEYVQTLSNHQTPAIIPGVCLYDINKLVELRRKYPIYKIGLGLHPWFINDYISDQKSYTQALLIKNLSNLVRMNLPDFIGEIGLDKYRENFDKQIDIFDAQLQVAQKFNLPVIIHCVRAYNEVLLMLRKYNIRRGIIHGFNANEIIARKFYSNGFLLGIGSNITKTSLITKSIRDIPLQYIVLESDAPYMPAFGKSSSESSDCFLYGQVLSQIVNINLIDLINQSNNNMLQLQL